MSGQDARPGPRGRDVVVAAVTTAAAVGTAVGFRVAAAGTAAGLQVPGNAVVWGLTVAVLLVQGLALCWGRSAPRVILVAVAALPAWLPLLRPGDLYSITDLPVIVAAFIVGAGCSLRHLRVVLPVAFALSTAGHIASALAEREPWAAATALGIGQAAIAIGIPLLLAVAISSRREARDARRGQRQASEREHDARVEAALAIERAAMARELHDIAAHHMSGIALMTAAIGRQIDTDPEQAKSSVQQVRGQSKAVLDDLRRAVGLLRDGDAAPGDVESLAALPGLVELRQKAGMSVSLELLASVDGRQLGDGIGPLAQRAVYRVVQEALSNAAAHAPGALCYVEVDDRDAAVLAVRIANGPAQTAPSDPSGGFGLLGMRERAQLVGGHLDYGATADGGWEVRLTVRKDPTQPATGAAPGKDDPREDAQA